MRKQNMEVIQYKMFYLWSQNKRNNFLIWHEETRLLILFLKYQIGVCEFMILTFEGCIFSLGQV